jgi:hypothetical protein
VASEPPPLEEYASNPMLGPICQVEAPAAGAIAIAPQTTTVTRIDLMLAP